ncbi:MAG: hypothetical protein ACI9C1_003947 [Candidatus Aldehydirespiratoraceae bacterium]|jgi:hypothetical protein
MHKRFVPLFLILAVAIALASCGDDSEADSTPPDSTPIEDSVELPDDAPADTPADETPADAPADAPADEPVAADDGSCAKAFTVAEYEQVFGTTVEINGGSKFCNVIFASDSIGAFSAFSGSEADEAMDQLLPAFEAKASVDGVLLDDGRGFIDGFSAVVLGDSGRVFRIDVPSNVDLPDVPAAMQAAVDILLTR